jgi:hypothetical protein
MNIVTPVESAGQDTTAATSVDEELPNRVASQAIDVAGATKVGSGVAST